MSFPLYRWLLRRAAATLASWVAALALYEWLLIWIYPSISQSTVLAAAMRTLPRELLSAFGLGSAHETLAIFLSSEFFSFIWILALVYFVAAEASRLPAGMLERGQMTPLLLTPASRSRIVLAAAGALLTEICVVVALSLGCAALLAAWYGVSLAGMDLALLGVGGVVVLSLVAALAIAASCLLSGERTVLGAAGGLAFIFYALDFAARISPRLSVLEHLTPFAAYRPEALLAGHAPVAQLVLLEICAVAILLLASALFARRDLRGA